MVIQILERKKGKLEGNTEIGIICGVGQIYLFTLE